MGGGGQAEFQSFVEDRTYTREPDEAHSPPREGPRPVLSSGICPSIGLGESRCSGCWTSEHRNSNWASPRNVDSGACREEEARLGKAEAAFPQKGRQTTGSLDVCPRAVGLQPLAQGLGLDSVVFERG